jgi:5-methylcytosine-specific restriction enzyme B
MSDDVLASEDHSPEVTESIATALTTWDPLAGGRIAQAEFLRQQFVEQFPISAWPELPLQSYALGQETDGGTVCWWMEWKTKLIASMSGGSAAKHLIFLRKKDQTWRYPKEYASVEEAWEAVRSGFVEAFALAETGEFDAIDEIKALRGAHALRTKLVYVYFPNELLPVTSKAHIDHFL